MVKTAAVIKRHLTALGKRDARIITALKLAGVPGPRAVGPGFATLIRIIGDQQVSTAAGAAIWAKLERNAGGQVSAAALLKLGETGLRASGFSGQKTRYALGVAEAVAAGTLDFAALELAGDEAVRAVLTAFKGIGDWTADIYLMFGMGRTDVWPVGDLALQIAAQMLHGLKERPSAKALHALGEAWRPYRSAAALLLWRYYGALRAQGRAAQPPKAKERHAAQPPKAKKKRALKKAAPPKTARKKAAGKITGKAGRARRR